MELDALYPVIFCLCYNYDVLNVAESGSASHLQACVASLSTSPSAKAVYAFAATKN